MDDENVLIIFEFSLMVVLITGCFWHAGYFDSKYTTNITITNKYWVDGFGSNFNVMDEYGVWHQAFVPLTGKDVDQRLYDSLECGKTYTVTLQGRFVREIVYPCQHPPYCRPVQNPCGCGEV